MTDEKQQQWKTGVAMSPEVKARLARVGEARGISMSGAAALILERVLVDRPELAAEALSVQASDLLEALRGEP